MHHDLMVVYGYELQLYYSDLIMSFIYGIKVYNFSLPILYNNIKSADYVHQ